MPTPWLGVVVLAFLLVRAAQARTMLFSPPASSGVSMDWATAANWNNPLPLTAADDVVVRITSCTLSATPYSVLNSAVSINSLTLDSQVVNSVGTASSCPSTLLINTTGALTVAGQVTVLSASKLGLYGGSLSCDTLQVQGSTNAYGVVAGSGVITVNTLVDLWANAYILPGMYAAASCDTCWPAFNPLPTVSALGDLRFVTPKANAAVGSVFVFKDLTRAVDMNTRLNPGLPYDTVTFTGLLNANGTALLIEHSNNSFVNFDTITQNGVALPILWGSSAVLLAWGQVNLIQPFAISNQANAATLIRCNAGFNAHFGALTSLWACSVVAGFDCIAQGTCSTPSCGQPALSGLSLLASPQPCPAQQQPVSPTGTTASGATTTTAGGVTNTTAPGSGGGLPSGAIIG